MEIAHAADSEQVEQVRALIRAFVAWHRERHVQDLHLIDKYFDANAFEQELAELPGKYGPPRGCLLLATLEGEPAGCVALQPISDSACEMKRMFVYPKFRGRGVGGALARRVIEEGRALGYSKMLLDTSIRQVEAQKLYRGLGFRDIEPYYEMPREVAEWLVFMEMDL